jgi:hypothetical protein
VKYNIINSNEGEQNERRIKSAKELIVMLDDLTGKTGIRQTELRKRIEKVNSDILCQKRELEWRSGGIRLNFARYMKVLVDIVANKGVERHECK